MKVKRVASFFLAILMLAFVFPAQALAEGESDYEISTAEELWAFADAVNGGETSASAVLTADINVSTAWTPVGSDSAPYTGRFDGDGHTITYTYQCEKTSKDGQGGLFGVIADGAVIKNLTVAGSVSAPYAGGVAAVAKGGVIQNCTIMASVSSGGIPGLDTGGVGGVVGSASGSTRIEGCDNHGAIKSTRYFFGGIAGTIADEVTVTACFNYGDITAAGSASGKLYVGGIVGWHAGTGTVSQCANLGSITSTTSTYLANTNHYIGGIVGYMKSGAVSSSYHAGNITGYRIHAGGIAGYAYKSTEVASCYNTGSVAVTGADTYAGGIAAQSGGATTVSGCFNVGAITADGTAQSIVGSPSSTSVISNNYYLEDCAADTKATSKTAEEFLTLASLLGEAYKEGPKYPLLVWQEDTASGVRTVVLNVTPAAASVTLTASTGTVMEPESVTGGIYTYQLDEEETYRYSVTLEGYYSVEAELPEESSSVSVVLQIDKRIPAETESMIYGDGNEGMPNTIVFGGTYQIGAGARGVMTVETTAPVTLIGTESTVANLYIDCTVAGVSLTLENVAISNGVASTNMFDFTGSGNNLYFSGTNLLEQTSGTSGYALIHVPAGTELTIGGKTAEDTLYLYKAEQGAGIGGNGNAEDGGQTPEYNGAITITQGRMFMKGTKQGALIGAGAGAGSAAGTPGDITIQGGFLNLITNARGAAIGGSAGETGATGVNVYLQGGTVTINVNFSGAAIGGGGYDGGNDADGGTLVYGGGSIRTYIDTNAVPYWDWADVTSAGINGNKAITADIVNANGKPLYLCILDTASIGGDSFTVQEGNTTIYTGGLHTYRYVNENEEKAEQDNVTDTTANWVASDDPNLYLYLTGEDHTLTINGAAYTAEWDEAGESFYVHPAEITLLTEPVLPGAAEITKDSVALAVPDASAQDEMSVLEYRVSADAGSTWGEWQTSPVFTGLKANTEYCFQARYRAGDVTRYSDSKPSAVVTFATAEDPNAFCYTSEASGQTVTASVSGTSFAEPGILTADLVTGASGIKQVTTTISGAALAALAEGGEAYSLALETDLGFMHFDYAALCAIARDSGGSDAVLTIWKYSDEEYFFQLTVDGKSIFTWAEGGFIYMELPYSRQDATKSVLVYDNAENKLEAEYNPRTETVAFAVSRLSSITIKELQLGDPYASVWDGLSLDISWFTPGKSSYYISTPAQLMGLAALVNGIYNDEITTIVGGEEYIVDHRANSNDTDSNNQSTDTYHYGSYDFAGATVYLTADLDMGGSNGCNYMPIGGQYLMSKGDTSTRIDASFCGVFDGSGHTVSNIYCDRYCSGNYGDGSSVGLIGRLGVHDNDDMSLRPTGAAVRNVAVDGYIYANRSVGGIVGKIGKTNGGATIESCANFATVISTDSKGCGGIVGAGWNGGIVRNCYNAGTIQSRYPNPTGGISGSNEITLENCYNIGAISASSASFAMAIGTNNGGAPYGSYVINCWYLEGSAPGGYYSGSVAYNDNALTAEYMKTPEFAITLGSAFAMDTAAVNKGYPVLAWQEQAEAGVVIKSTTTVEQDVAHTAVTEKAVSASVAAAQKLNADTLFIVTDTDGRSAGQTITAIPRSSMEEIGAASLNLTVQTADGSKVTMTARILTYIAARAAGTTVTLTVTPQTETYAKNLLGRISGYENTYLTNSATVSVGLSSGGAEITSFTSSFSVEIPVDSKNFQAGKTYDVLQVSSDGAVTKLSGQCASSGGQLYISFTAYRLGSFIVLNNAPVIYGDVLPEDWFYDAVMDMTDLGLMNGIGDNQFDPYGTTNRAMLVTVLYRLENEPATAASNAFTDVAAGTWYTNAVNWASAKKIVEGYGNGSFGSDDKVTREQIATIMYRYMQYRGLDVSARGSLSQFRDGGQTSDWAYTAMQWAVGSGILVGDDYKSLNPGGAATRAEIATMLQRLINLIEQ